MERKSTRSKMQLACVLWLAQTMLPCEGWVFRGVVPQDAPVVSVAIWESRAFLAVPRVWRDPRDPLYTFLHDGATLLSAPWPEPGRPEECLPRNATLAMRVSRARARLRGTPLVPRAFPTLAEQELSRPDCLQSATAVALECARGAARLWVLDSGEVPTHALAPGPRSARGRCAPKVVVYSLRGNNQKVWLRPFDGVPNSAVSGLAVDPATQDTRAYVAYPDAPGGAAIIVLSLKNKAFWHVRLQGLTPPSPQPEQPRFEATPSPLGRRGRGPRRRVPRQAPQLAQRGQWDVAVTRASSKRPRMIVAPRESPFMYDVTLDALRGPAPDANHRNDALVPSSELGARRLVRKPGPGASSGLLADPEGGLIFFQTAPEGGAGAVIRWDARRGAGPRGYAVLLRDNDTLPIASALFLDGQGAAWASCTTFSSHHGSDAAGIHHAEEDVSDDDYDADDEDDLNDDDSEVGAEDDTDHDDLEIHNGDTGDHNDNVEDVLPPPPMFRRSNSCRFPRAVGWRIRQVPDRHDDDADSSDSEGQPAAEPQEYVCMSPDAQVAILEAPPCAPTKTKSSRKTKQRAKGGGKDGDANTIMITRRSGVNDGLGLRTAAGYQKTLLVHDGDRHPNRPLNPVTHCVRLRWEEPES